MVSKDDGKVEVEFVFFRDRDRRHQEDGKFNKAGYVVGGTHVIHLQGNHLVKTQLGLLKEFSPEVTRIPLDAAVGQAVHEFFIAVPLDPRRFGYAMNALITQDWKYFTHPAPPLPKPAFTLEQHSARWDSFWALPHPGDLVCTFDSTSRISRLISWVDRGPWSHTAMYSGQGTVIEAITSGCVERPIEVYRKPQFRLGLYRYRDVDPERAVARMRAGIGAGYNYWGALRAGVGKYFNLWERGPGTPNDLIATPGIQHISYV